MMSSNRWSARAVALVLGAFCVVAAAAEPPGWLLLFSTDDGRLESTSIVATPAFVPGRDAGDARWTVRVVDDTGRVLYAAPFASPLAGAHEGHVDARARRIAVRVPALSLARRIEIVDAGGAIAWRRNVDAAFRAQAHDTAERTAATLAKALRKSDAPPSDAIAREFSHRRDAHKRALLDAIGDYNTTPDDTRRERLERLLEPATATTIRTDATARAPVATRDRALPTIVASNASAAVDAAAVDTSAPHADATPDAKADIDTPIDIAVRPAADGPMPAIDWQASCFNGPDFAGFTGHGAQSGTMTVKARRPYRCTFTPDAPYRTLTYPGLVFDSGQAWLPAVLRGNAITLNVTGDGAASAGDGVDVYLDGFHTTYASATTGWQFIAPTGTAVISRRGTETTLPAAIGPRRIDGDATLDLV
ncbi:MAG TPA: hypothetical protein VJ724_04715, partial [Tahibacter sp.]|nr:hypothetical protein [Tahibacter sp.]